MKKMTLVIFKLFIYPLHLTIINGRNLLFALLTLLSSICMGQLRVLDSLAAHDTFISIGIRDSSNKDFFKKNRNVKSIRVTYNEGKPLLVLLSGERNFVKDRKSELFDMSFEGDHYAFTYKYGTIKYADFPFVCLGDANFNRDHLSSFKVRSSLYTKDSVFHNIGEIWEGMPVRRREGDHNSMGSPAKYGGDIDALEKKVAEGFKSLSIAGEIDSILVLQATIEKDGRFHSLEKIAGRNSTFSECVEKIFKEFEIVEPSLRPKPTAWKPALSDPGGVRSKLRVLVRLNTDGTVSIETSSKLRRILIE